MDNFKSSFERILVILGFAGLVNLMFQNFLKKREKTKQLYAETWKAVIECSNNASNANLAITHVFDEELSEEYIVREYSNLESAFSNLKRIVEENSPFYYSKKELEYLKSIMDGCHTIKYIFMNEYISNDAKSATINKENARNLALKMEETIKKNKELLKGSIEKRFKVKMSFKML